MRKSCILPLTGLINGDLFIHRMERTHMMALAVLALSLFLLLNADDPPENSAFITQGGCDAGNVLFFGTVMGVNQLETVMRLRMLPFERPITVVAFPRESFNATVGDVLRIEGRWQEYRGRSEIIADRIERRME